MNVIKNTLKRISELHNCSIQLFLIQYKIYFNKPFIAQSLPTGTWLRVFYI